MGGWGVDSAPQPFRGSGAWETLRRKVLARDQGVCYLCDRRGADEVDHLLGPEHNDLAALASAHHGCHERRHREPEWARERVALALSVLGVRGT